MTDWQLAFWIAVVVAVWLVCELCGRDDGDAS